MNVISMMHEINVVPNPVIGESALPDLLIASNNAPEFVRVRAFDQLDGPLNSRVACRSQQQMKVLRHHHKGMQFITALATMPIDGLQKDPHIDFHDEQFAAVVGRESHEIRSGWRDESSRLQRQTPAAESRASVWSLNWHEWNSCPSRLLFFDVSRFGTNGPPSGRGTACPEAEDV
jgi:hypothetical protein